MTYEMHFTAHDKAEPILVVRMEVSPQLLAHCNHSDPLNLTRKLAMHFAELLNLDLSQVREVECCE